jgi:hypothetical protein
VPRTSSGAREEPSKRLRRLLAARVRARDPIGDGRHAWLAPRQHRPPLGGGVVVAPEGSQQGRQLLGVRGRVGGRPPPAAQRLHRPLDVARPGERLGERRAGRTLRGPLHHPATGRRDRAVFAPGGRQGPDPDLHGDRPVRPRPLHRALRPGQHLLRPAPRREELEQRREPGRRAGRRGQELDQDLARLVRPSRLRRQCGPGERPTLLPRPRRGLRPEPRRQRERDERLEPGRGAREATGPDHEPSPTDRFSRSK